MTAVVVVLALLLAVLFVTGAFIGVRRMKKGAQRGARSQAPRFEPHNDDQGPPTKDAIAGEDQSDRVDSPRGVTAPTKGPLGLAGRLDKAKALLAAPLGAIRSSSRVDDQTFEDLEEALILADVGLPTTTRLLNELRAGLRSGAITSEPEVLLSALKNAIVGCFSEKDRELHLSEESPSVWLFVGVNGVGKTTTIGKCATRAVNEGKTVVLAAGDTFRAAATDQLDLWANRSGSEIVRGSEGADPSSVIFDAVAHAAAIHADLVLADSAGRLHTKVNLMSELTKVRRIAGRPPGHLCEVILVIDATTGQNGLVQARQFAEAVEVTGVALTKLDGTAKGGIVVAIASELNLPVKLVGIGEQPEDLIAFDPTAFVGELFG